METFKEVRLDNAFLFAVTQSSGREIEKLMALSEANLGADIMLSVESELSDPDDVNQSRAHSESEHERRSSETVLTKILYLNGHPLLNTRLLV